MALITLRMGVESLEISKVLRLRVPSDIPRTMVMAEVETRWRTYPNHPVVADT